MRRLHTQVKISQQIVRRLTAMLVKKTELNGVNVDSDLYFDLSTIATPSVLMKHPPELIFWEQQVKASSIKILDLVDDTLVYLRRAYENLRATNIIKLPSQRTLRDYIYYTNAKPGFLTSSCWIV